MLPWEVFVGTVEGRNNDISKTYIFIRINLKHTAHGIMKRLVDVLIGNMIGNQLHMTARVEILQNGVGTISKISEYVEPVEVEIYDNWLMILPEAISVLEGINFGSDGKGRLEAVDFLETLRTREKYVKEVMLLT